MLWSRAFLLASLLVPLAQGAPDPRFDAGGAAPLGVDRFRPETSRDGRLWISADAADAAARTRALEAGLSIDEIFPDRVEGVGTAAVAARLSASGFKTRLMPLGVRFSAKDFPPQDAAYHDYARMEAALDTLVASGKGSIVKFSIGRSVQGREIWGVRFHAPGPDRPAAAFLGAHHAREHLSVEVPLRLAQYLADNRAKPAVASLLAARDVYVIPMTNPDGAEFDVNCGGDRPAAEKCIGAYRMHRKNMRENGDGSVGVDLNRNYGYHWGEAGDSPDPGSDTYRGPEPFSEPESRAVKAFVDARAASLKVLVSYHSFSELVLYPWSYSHEPIDDPKALAAYRAMAGRMAAMTGYTAEPSGEMYLSSGDTCDWAWGAHRVFSLTVELSPKRLSDGGFYPGAAAIAPAVATNLAPALYLIRLADDPYRAATENSL